MTAERQLQLLLRALGTFDLLACGGVLMPDDWMAATHAWLGMGDFPRAPVVDYLARSASLMYAQHGAVFLFLSTDVRRFRPLIRFMAVVALLSGGIMLAIDLLARIPLFWTIIEGPGYILLAITVLALCRRVSE
ncbi:MAG TPA: hypothetical protein VFI31_27415 [Pirellulales bacterium]|nr:hypothetical protein [Pirellulales bacterium]